MFNGPFFFFFSSRCSTTIEFHAEQHERLLSFVRYFFPVRNLIICVIPPLSPFVFFANDISLSALTDGLFSSSSSSSFLRPKKQRRFSLPSLHEWWCVSNGRDGREGNWLCIARERDERVTTTAAAERIALPGGQGTLTMSFYSLFSASVTCANWVD